MEMESKERRAIMISIANILNKRRENMSYVLKVFGKYVAEGVGFNKEQGVWDVTLISSEVDAQSYRTKEQAETVARFVEQHYFEEDGTQVTCIVEENYAKHRITALKWSLEQAQTQLNRAESNYKTGTNTRADEDEIVKLRLVVGSLKELMDKEY